MGMHALWQDDRDARWQQHYDEYIESFDGEFSEITGPIAAEQYADDMMEEEDRQREPRKPFVPDPQYIAWLAEVDAKRAELMALRDADGSLGDPFEKRRRAA